MNSRIGYWLTIIVTTICVLLVIGAAMTYLQVFSNDVYLRDKTSFPSDSVAQSKERGAFKYALSASPATTAFGNRVSTFGDAWVEQRMQPVFKYVWFKRWEPQEGELLVVSTENLPFGVAVIADGGQTPLQHQSRHGQILLSGPLADGSTGAAADSSSATPSTASTATRQPIRLHFYKTTAGVTDKEAPLGEITLEPAR